MSIGVSGSIAVSPLCKANTNPPPPRRGRRHARALLRTLQNSIQALRLGDFCRVGPRARSRLYPAQTSHAKLRQPFIVRWPHPRVRSTDFSLKPRFWSNRSPTRTDPWHASSRCLVAMAVLPPLPSGAILIVLRTSRSSRLRLPQRQVSGAFRFSPPFEDGAIQRSHQPPMALLQRARRSELWSRSCQGQRAGENPSAISNFLSQAACPFVVQEPRPSLHCYVLAFRVVVGLLRVLHLWAPMQDSGRLRLQSIFTMQPGSANCASSPSVA